MTRSGTGLLLVGVLAAGCSKFHLVEQEARLVVERRTPATHGSCAVLPFRYEPEDPDEAGRVSDEDLAQWQRLFADALDRSGVFGSVLAVDPGEPALGASYVLHGHVTKYNFQKNWVPTFFPVHVVLTLSTLSLYTLLGGTTTVTDVDLAMHFELREADSQRLVAEFTERFEDTSALNAYRESGRDNPYHQPGIPLSELVDRAAGRLALAVYP